MMLNDHGKLLVLLIALVGAFAGLLTGRLAESAGVGIITGVIGYVTGNGVLAARKQAPSPVIAAKDTALALVSSNPAPSNAEWARRAVAWLAAHGETFASADLAVNTYLAGDPLSTRSQELVGRVLASAVGAPPELPTTRKAD